MPSRPVRAPISTTRLPGPVAARAAGRSARSRPTHIALTRRVVPRRRRRSRPRRRRSARRCSCRSGRCPRTTPRNRCRLAALVERAEAQRVEQRDRPRAHREDVAQDAADAGGRALEGLDRRGVVVALDLERHGQAVADVDHAGVLARALQHAPRRSWAAAAAAGASACSRSARSTAGENMASSRSLGSRPSSSLDALEPRRRSARAARWRGSGVTAAHATTGRRAKSSSPAAGRGRPSSRAAGRRRARGGASARARCPPRLATPATRVDRAVGVVAP